MVRFYSFWDSSLPPSRIFVRLIFTLTSHYFSSILIFWSVWRFGVGLSFLVYRYPCYNAVIIAHICFQWTANSCKFAPGRLSTTGLIPKKCWEASWNTRRLWRNLCLCFDTWRKKLFAYFCLNSGWKRQRSMLNLVTTQHPSNASYWQGQESKTTICKYCAILVSKVISSINARNSYARRWWLTCERQQLLRRQKEASPSMEITWWTISS